MPAMLLQLYDRLGLGNSADALFWAICLVAFYGVFRKFHLLPVLTSSFDLCKQLTKAGFRIFPWGVLITIRWSKTIQFLEWIVEIPLPYIPCSKLCPTAAITNAFCFTATASAFNSQAFNWVDQKQLVKIFTYESFVSTLRIHFTSLGFDPKLFAGHSFRRGGAPFAYQVAVPIKLIKALGNWHSDTILIYLTMPLTIRLYSANMLSKAILPHTPHHFHNTNLTLPLLLPLGLDHRF